MGGNNRKKVNKSKPRRPGPSSANRGLFVEGGLLSDWSPFDSPPSRGSKVNNGGNGNSKSGSRSGAGGAGKGSNSDSKSGPRTGVRIQSRMSNGNAIGYVYPSQENAFHDGAENEESELEVSNPAVLIDSQKSPVVAYADEAPVEESQNVEYNYDYSSSFTPDESLHRGLGFYDEMETHTDGIGSSSKVEEKESDSSGEGEMDANVDFVDDVNAEFGEDRVAEVSSPEENSGYVIIGGTKIYTQDISDEDDEEEELSDDESSDSSGSEDCSATSESDDSSSGSDIDDEVAADYLEGIGGVSNIINVVKGIPSVSEDVNEPENLLNYTVRRFSGIALQEASMKYGIKIPGSGRKSGNNAWSSALDGNYAWSSALDDLMFVKDPRTVSGRKKHVARLPQSWPSEPRKSKKHRAIPGEKKKHRKELIAAKRRDRMIRRGVDLQKINLKLQQMVEDGVDMFSFQPMHSRDCSQVRRLAGIYRLRSGCQGSGKKGFVTVTRTQHTCMPSSSDKIRLEKLIGANDEDADFSIDAKMGTNSAKKAARIGSYTPVGSQSSKVKSNQKSANHSTGRESKSNKSRESKSNKSSGKVGSYAAQPLSFVSSGTLNAEIVELEPIESIATKGETSGESKTVVNSIEYRAFEMHTTGFGSKMMAKMGYVEGGGLGKDGQGMAQPIEVSQRPKSLGLGAQVPEINSTNIQVQPRAKSMGRGNGKSTKSEVDKIGSFEKHTKGFGSKMMTKMGFVEGSGLGRNSQGMVNPLVAVRRPKARGLGATS